MKANETHISLETAKLLKDCGVESKFHYINGKILKSLQTTNQYSEVCPAYTWQEILWEYAEYFFVPSCATYDSIGREVSIDMATHKIIKLLQQKKYDEADAYFRDNSVLIKK